MTTSLVDDFVHFFNLSLGSTESSQSLLCDLSGSLLTSVSDQFDQSSFVWSQRSDFLNDASDENGSLGSSTLSVRDLWGWGQLVDLLTFV